MRRLDTRSGFALVDLMIAIAIIGMLAGVAISQYAAYTKRAKFSEAIALTAERRSAVHLCYQEDDDLDRCNGTGLATDYPGIPADVAFGAGRYTESVTTSGGEITVQATDAVDGHTYVLTPDDTGGRMTWSANGSCVTAGLCRAIS